MASNNTETGPVSIAKRKFCDGNPPIHHGIEYRVVATIWLGNLIKKVPRFFDKKDVLHIYLSVW